MAGRADGSLIVRSHATEARQVNFMFIIMIFNSNVEEKEYFTMDNVLHVFLTFVSIPLFSR